MVSSNGVAGFSLEKSSFNSSLSFLIAMFLSSDPELAPHALTRIYTTLSSINATYSYKYLQKNKKNCEEVTFCFLGAWLSLGGGKFGSVAWFNLMKYPETAMVEESV